MLKVRLQFPDTATVPREEELRTLVGNINRRLENAVQDGVIPSRPRFENPEITRTTGGPALVLKTMGDVSDYVLGEVELVTEAFTGQAVREVLVLEVAGDRPDSPSDVIGYAVLEAEMGSFARAGFFGQQVFETLSEARDVAEPGQEVVGLHRRD